MFRTKLIILAWLLLLVPTLLLGVGAWQLLQNESDRLALHEQQSAAARLTAVGGNLELAIAEVKDGLMQRLVSFATGDLPLLLGNWRLENPLVRNVFVLQAGTRLVYPDPEMPASDEERLFIRRYLPLFSGELNWQQPATDLPAPPAALLPTSADAVLSERKELRQLASKALSPGIIAGLEKISAERGESGWRSWYADNQLHLLGWYHPAGGNQRYGVEIEMMALLSRLLGSLRLPYGTDESLALLDGSNHIFHQSGPFEISAKSIPAASHAIDSLPHWRLNIYRNLAANSAQSGFLLIGSLLTGSFIVAILLGGSLLLWQAFRNQRDAQQKTSFVSNVSHELKTPLTTIRMYAELLGEGKIDSVQKQQTYLQTIIRESQRLTRLVNNILDFSRLEQGSKTFNCHEIDLIELVEEILSQQAPRLYEAGLEPEKNLGIDKLLIDIDQDAVEQILLNLLDNAIKYAPGSGKLTLSLQREQEHLQLVLSDRGPGIPANQQQKIFDKFYRLDSSLTSAQPGAGLGLSIARQLARGLGGELHCSAGEAGGVSFYLTLPLPLRSHHE